MTIRFDGVRTMLAVCLCAALAAAAMVPAGCTGAETPAKTPAEESSVTAQGNPLPDSAYYVDPALEEWIDPDTGYDTTRDWALEDEEWPVALIMSPSQSPQLLAGEAEGLFTKALEPLGIKPVIEKIELPPRTFHALQRSKWAFAYMPYAVFTDYCRTNDNQGGAGGLQYVALAGSTAGGGYTLITRDPEIQTVEDLAGKTVAGLENNPARIVLMEAAAKQAGLKLGDGEGDIRYSTGGSAEDMNAYLDGEFDALVVLSITKDRFLRMGSRAITDFTDVGYTPSYTILTVERSVLDERPEVVDAFLEAHYQGNVLAEQMTPLERNTMLMESWNGYFMSEETTVAAQRIMPNLESFELMLGNMKPEQRIDPDLLGDCFAYLDENDAWGWDGAVDWQRLLALDRYDAVLKSNGEEPQAAASRD